MTESEFWEIIEKAKGSGGDFAHSVRLSGLLKNKSPQEIVSFQNHFYRIHQDALKGDIWAAGMLVNGGHGTDDGFEFFRNWLIGQGRSVFDRVYANPDALAEILASIEVDEIDAEWESYGYVASDVYRKLINQELNVLLRSENKTSVPSKIDLASYTDEILAQNFPKLWAKFGAEKVKFNQTKTLHPFTVQSAEVKGLGVISIGDVLIHKKFGAGKVINIEKYNDANVTGLISFSDQDRAISFSPEFAHLWTIQKDT